MDALLYTHGSLNGKCIPVEPSHSSKYWSNLSVYVEWGRSSVSSFVPSDQSLYATVNDTSFVDNVPSTIDIFYVVSAFDFNGNESSFSSEIGVDGTDNLNINKIIPVEYELMAAYPNPFNPVTNLEYGLVEYTNVQIVIFDLVGKQVEVLINKFQAAGYHSVVWNASNYPSGVYFVKMITDDYVNTEKLMLVK